MPTNANTFNSRVTSEALEAKYRQVFPSQGGAELVQDLFASGVIQPVVDFSTVAEGSVLSPNLQTAWDFSTGSFSSATAGVSTLISNPGFWLIDVTATGFAFQPVADSTIIRINDGTSTKPVWAVTAVATTSTAESGIFGENRFVVFLRAGDTLEHNLTSTSAWQTDIWYRQIADVNGTLVNPLGFTFS